MPLTFTVLRCPDTVAPETRTIAGGEFIIGRGPGVDWVLPDPERLLSKHHFAVAYRGGAWQVADTSTNGTYLNADQEPIGRGEIRSLRDGDRLKLGPYELEVRITADAALSSGGSFAAGPTAGASPFADPFRGDPFAPPPPAPTPFGDPVYPLAESPSAAQLPADFDPLAPDPDEAPFHGPTQNDHSPLLEDAFRAPSITGQMPLHGGTLPGDDLLPDDWDKDLLEGIGSPSPAQRQDAPLFAPAQPMVQPVPSPIAPVASPTPAIQAGAPPVAQPLVQPVQPVVQPMVQPLVQPVVQPVVEPILQPVVQPLVQPMVESLPPTAAPALAHPAPLIPPGANPFDEPFAAVEEAPLRIDGAAASAPAPAPVAQPASMAKPADSDALLAAFLQGAGLADARPADPLATMHGLGEAFRALVSGLRAVLIARASVKSEFRIEQTMIRARGNNPLKFSADDDDALAALLGTGRRTDMSAAAAVADALKDIKLHELASMAAMQSAVRTLLDGLDPARLRAQAEQGGGLSVLPAQRKARAWDAFEALHARTTQALSDDFDSVFGKAFARAYEQAMEDVSAKERR